MIHYALFRFYSNQESVAVTNRERLELRILGEFMALRVIPYRDQDDLIPQQVWKHLGERGLLTPPRTLITQGKFLGHPVSDARSWDSIDTQNPQYRDWVPHQGHCLKNPCLCITVEACPV